MATVTSASTTAQIAAAYLDNCGYVEDDDSAMAKRFVTACMAMLKRGVRTIEHAGERMEFSPPDLRELIKEANRFIGARAGVAAGGSGVKHASFKDFRT